MSRRSANTTKIFVGSLPPGTTVDELRNLFSSYGGIAECDVVNRCGFLHLENKQLAFKAIDELNNTTFKGSRISVEKGRVKPPPNRSGRGERNGFNGGPMRGGPIRGGRDNFRGAPYSRGSGSDYDRRGPRGGGPMRRDNGYGGGQAGYDRGYDSRPPPPNMMPHSRGMNDGYGGPDRRPYMDDRRGGYPDDRRYSESNYAMGPGGDSRLYPEDRGLYPDDRQYDRRPLMDDRRPLDERNLMDDRRPGTGALIMDRRPLMDSQIPPVLANSGMGVYPSLAPLQSSYDRRPPLDMYSRRNLPTKPMGGGGAYNEPPRDSGYDSAYPPLQQRGYAGGPGPRRDMPPARRY